MVNSTGLKYLAAFLEDLDNLDISFNGTVTFINLEDGDGIFPLDAFISVSYNGSQNHHEIALG